MVRALLLRANRDNNSKGLVEGVPQNTETAAVKPRVDSSYRSWQEVRGRRAQRLGAGRSTTGVAPERDRQAIWFVGRFRQLYRIEDEARDQTPEERQALRQAPAIGQKWTLRPIPLFGIRLTWPLLGSIPATRDPNRDTMPQGEIGALPTGFIQGAEVPCRFVIVSFSKSKKRKSTCSRCLNLRFMDEGRGQRTPFIFDRVAKGFYTVFQMKGKLSSGVGLINRRVPFHWATAGPGWRQMSFKRASMRR
jgi:hypothetical protein